MSILNDQEVIEKVVDKVSDFFVVYKQYLHKGECISGPCGDSNIKDDLCCAPFIWCVHASNALHKLPKHPNCDCYYQNLETLSIGTISDRQPSPDVWLKLFGKLPDYYITKEQAQKLGWRKGKDLSKFAPGKMIGGEEYENKDYILPEKEGRIWYECDINYTSGKRNSLRLYYSNDELMFYSPNHLENNVKVYWIK